MKDHPFPVLFFLASVALALASCPPKQLFVPTNRSSVLAPNHFVQLAPVSAESHCSLLCALRLGCFGFYWSPSACRLFNTSAFFRIGQWLGIHPAADVYLRNFTISTLQLSSCSQSSTGSEAGCERAIDGKANQNFFTGSCTHTKCGSNEWWEAQLPRPALVSTVTIYNRQDCCADRLNQFSLQVDGVECNRVNLSIPFSIANFSCHGYGSRVRVASLQSECVTICESMAYGYQSP